MTTRGTGHVASAETRGNFAASATAKVGDIHHINKPGRISHDAVSRDTNRTARLREFEQLR